MTTHRYHPSDLDPKDAVLFDDCPRCREQAEDLFGLDDFKFRDLWNRLEAVESNEELYRTHTEARAGRQLYKVALAFERLTGEPWRTLRRKSAV